MGLLDLIDKLIIEHGSAVVLRDNLAFVRDRVAGLQMDNAALKEEKKALTRELMVLKARIDQLDVEKAALIRQNQILVANVQDLQDQIKEAQSKDAGQTQAHTEYNELEW